MNTLARITPDITFPWFEDYKEVNHICKVYNDGSCYIAIPTIPGVKNKKKGKHVVLALFI